MPSGHRVEGKPEVILPPDGVRIKAGIMLVRNRVGSSRRDVWHIQWQSGDHPGLSVRAGIEGLGGTTGTVEQKNF